MAANTTSVLDQLSGSLQGNTNAAANPLAAPSSAFEGPSRVQQAQGVLEAKSGKANTSGTGPKQSNLGELQARSQAASYLEQNAVQGQAAQAQLQNMSAAQDQAVEAQNQNLGEKELDLASQYAQKAQSILQSFGQGMAELDFKKQTAKVEQLGAAARLSSDKYITNLKLNGAKSRLFNKVNFEEELLKSMFSDEQDLLTSDLQFKSILRQEGREFAQSLAELDIEWAIQMAGEAAKAESTRQVVGGVQGVATAGIKAYSNRDVAEKDKPSGSSTKGLFGDPFASGGE